MCPLECPRPSCKLMLNIPCSKPDSCGDHWSADLSSKVVWAAVLKKHVLALPPRPWDPAALGRGRGEWSTEGSETLGCACSQLNVLVLSCRGPLTNVP